MDYKILRIITKLKNELKNKTLIAKLKKIIYMHNPHRISIKT